jgi:hypothetical protein
MNQRWFVWMNPPLSQCELHTPHPYIFTHPFSHPQTFFLYRLQLARELSASPQFYFPHNLDFRGRAYPMHPYLHHMGDDVTRGLLTFSEARPLGPGGLQWLKVHVSTNRNRGLFGAWGLVCFGRWSPTVLVLV